MKLFLAPMEGITDFVMRDLLTQSTLGLGGIDQCTTEFIRITHNLHPKSVYYRYCPELHMGSRTRSGVPVFVQLLGGQPDPMAENAVRAADLGAAGIDLNFGCPAKTVNRHDGGACLLQTPHRIFDIVSAVRKAVPTHVPMSVKMRLGFENTDLFFENALAAENAGASWLTVHCRTKVQGYKPPAHWQWLVPLKEKIKIPIVANGDIQTIEDFETCRKVTGTDHFMIGRAALTNPFLFQQIKKSQRQQQPTAHSWKEISVLLPSFFQASCTHINLPFAVARTKQWLKALSPKDPEAFEFFQSIKTLKGMEFEKNLSRVCTGLSHNVLTIHNSTFL